MQVACQSPLSLRQWPLLKNDIKRLLQQLLVVSTSCRQNSGTSGKYNDKTPKVKYDAVVVGAGHNGLISAAYLQKAGIRTCVLERRHVVGGAAVTEEIVPGFKFSRASYVLSLLRPVIYQDLELKKHGLKVYKRDPNSFTPLSQSQWKEGKPRSLSMYMDEEKKRQELARFSPKDAEAYFRYDALLGRIADCLGPLLDNPPPDLAKLLDGRKISRKKLEALVTVKPLWQLATKLGKDLPAFLELCTAPASKILDRWFETDVLKSTLATDGVIGAMQSPSMAGSGYVLLHHVMGSIDGVPGIWGYVEGGMGSVTKILAKIATERGADIFTNAPVKQIKTDAGKAVGVVLEDGREIEAKMVLSNATPKVTFLDLLQKEDLNEEFSKEIASIDYTSPVTKINLALSRLPNFLSLPNQNGKNPMPHHHGSIHINCERIGMLEEAFNYARQGLLPKRPMIEMVLPSSLDPTLAPKDNHVCLMFTQFTPYLLANGKKWDEHTKKEYFDIVTNSVEAYAPGFRDSIIGYEVLSPPDLESIFGLTGGNIFHGTMSLDQLYHNRPSSRVQPPRTPLKGLYLCGSGTHPGGGVMGSSGRIGALVASKDFHLTKPGK